MGDSDEGASDRPSEEEPPKDSFFIADHLTDTKASLLIAPGVPTVASDRTGYAFNLWVNGFYVQKLMGMHPFVSI